MFSLQSLKIPFCGGSSLVRIPVLGILSSSVSVLSACVQSSGRSCSSQSLPKIHPQLRKKCAHFKQASLKKLQGWVLNNFIFFFFNFPPPTNNKKKKTQENPRPFFACCTKKQRMRQELIPAVPSCGRGEMVGPPGAVRLQTNKQKQSVGFWD